MINTIFDKRIIKLNTYCLILIISVTLLRYKNDNKTST